MVHNHCIKKPLFIVLIAKQTCYIISLYGVYEQIVYNIDKKSYSACLLAIHLFLFIHLLLRNDVQMQTPKCYNCFFQLKLV